MQNVPKNAKIEKIKMHLQKNQATYFAIGVIGAVSIGYFVGQKNRKLPPADVHLVLDADGKILSNSWNRDHHLPKDVEEQVKDFATTFRQGVVHIITFSNLKRIGLKDEYVLTSATPVE